MDFEHSAKVRTLQDKLVRFFEEHILPNERAYDEELAENRRRGDAFAPLQLIERLKPKARAAG